MKRNEADSKEVFHDKILSSIRKENKVVLALSEDDLRKMILVFRRAKRSPWQSEMLNGLYELRRAFDEKKKETRRIETES